MEVDLLLACKPINRNKVYYYVSDHSKIDKRILMGIYQIIIRSIDLFYSNFMKMFIVKMPLEFVKKKKTNETVNESKTTAADELVTKSGMCANRFLHLAL